jgi:SmpA / OmlA family
MSGRKVRNVLFLAIVAGIGYWIYTTRPTVSGIIDSITRPLLGSRAAVDSSEHNRVGEDASTVVAEQSDSRVTSLKEGMTRDDIREVLGRPDSVENFKTDDGVARQRWTYRQARRVIVFDERGRVVSISLL